MMPGMTEIVVVLAIVIILFGGKKIPELAKGLGRGIKDFKKAIKEDKDDDENSDTKEIKNKDNK